MKINRIIYDMSVAGATRAGVYVFAVNLLKALRVSNTSHEIVIFSNPFSTINKKGVFRKFTSLLRLLFNELIYFKGSGRDFYFFPSHELPFSIILTGKHYGVTIHDLYTWKNRGDTTLFAIIKLKILPFILSRAEVIFTVSRFSKDEIVEVFNIDDQKVHIIPNALNENFKNVTDRHLPYTQLDGEEYILNVGSLEPRKNISFLLEVFLYIKEHFPERRKLKLVLTGGESWKVNTLMERIRNCKFHQDIFILGNVDDNVLPSLYRNASVMVFPSKAEGFGIPVIEALSQGTPVVVNNNTALSEFAEYGATILNSFNIDEWGFTINSIITKHVRVPNNTITNILNKYDWNTSANALLDILKQ